MTTTLSAAAASATGLATAMVSAAVAVVFAEAFLSDNTDGCSGVGNRVGNGK